MNTTELNTQNTIDTTKQNACEIQNRDHDGEIDTGGQVKPLWKRCLQLVLCFGGLLFFMFVFTPKIMAHSEIHQKFMTAVEDLGVPTTATYYNDLPFINEAYIMLLDSWRFHPHGGKTGTDK